MSSNTIYCKHCNTPLSSHSKKFCNSSCAASFNNKGVQRHGNPPKECHYCGKPHRNSKYCSIECSAKDRTIALSEADKKRLRCEKVMRYRARKRSQTPEDADLAAIRKIYLNCPDGYEIDHIIPLSKGGLHHQDNLQYLTRSENASKGNKLDWQR